MIRTTPAILGIILLCGLAVPRPVQAQAGTDTRVEIGFYSGVVGLDENLTGKADPSPELVVGVRVGGGLWRKLNWFVDGEAAGFETETFAGNGRLGAARAGGEWVMNPERRAQLFLSAGWGYMGMTFANATDFHSTVATLGVGQHVLLSGATRLRWEFRLDHTLAPDGLRGEDLTQAQVTVGVNWGVGRRRQRSATDGDSDGDGDGDGDGVRDKRDRCPETPSGATVDAAGCPADADGDGVWDGLDRCPGTPPSSPVDGAGCVADADGDGLPDQLDKCPATPPGAPVDVAGCAADADGDGVPDVTDACPRTLKGIEVDEKGCFLDRDADGVYDGLGMDHCPGTPPGVKVDAFGCPIDSDGDGVPDGLDKCPDTPPGTPVEEEGCPRKG